MTEVSCPWMTLYVVSSFLPVCGRQFCYTKGHVYCFWQQNKGRLCNMHYVIVMIVLLSRSATPLESFKFAGKNSWTIPAALKKSRSSPSRYAASFSERNSGSDEASSCDVIHKLWLIWKRQTFIWGIQHQRICTCHWGRICNSMPFSSIIEIWDQASSSRGGPSWSC